MQTSDAAPKCQYCGSFRHPGTCPTVKAFEYHPDGTLKRVEFKTGNDYQQQVISVPSVFSVGDAPARSIGTTSAHPSLCDSGGELWDADEAS